MDFYFPISISLHHLVSIQSSTEKLQFEEAKTYSFSNLVIPLILDDIQFVPCFLIHVHILPFVSSSPYLCTHLDKASFVGEDCRDSVPDGTAVVVGSGDTEQLSPLAKAEIPPIEGVDVDTEGQPVGWAPGRETGHQVVVDDCRPD